MDSWGRFRYGLAVTLFCLGSAAHAQNPAPLIVDGDGDGVSDEMDDCPYTPPHTPVDARGCPVQGDADGDGVPDSIDDCPYTPKGARVDAHGCALDSDFDGVPDGIDQCPNTPLGERVDETGCMPGERAGRLKTPAATPSTSTTPAKPARTAPRSTTSKALDATLDAALSSGPVASVEPASPAAGPVAPPPAIVEAPPPVLATVPSPEITTPAPAVSAAPAVLPPAAELPPLPSALSATLVTVEFPVNSMELSEAGFGQLREAARRIQSTLAANPGTHVLVEGHSLKAESAGLDHQRALLVRAFLMSRGVNADDVSTQAPDEPTTKANGRQVRVRLTPPATATP